METLIIKSRNKIARTPQAFKRYLYPRINTNNQLIAIVGARGVGKTTLLLQLGNEYPKDKVFYVSLDDLFFGDMTLYGLAEQFSQLGGELLLLDEVHKYPNWSRELKLIYDDFPTLKTICTSSSILDIYKGESDLSRRVISYTLKALSFREYLQFFEGHSFPSYTLHEIIENHEDIARTISQDIKPLAHFKNYLKIGAFPFYNANEDEYYQQLIRTINLILEVDLPSIQNIDYQNITKIKRLLYILAKNVPFTPNVSKLSERIMLPRNTLVQVFQWLSKAQLIHSYFKTGKSISSLNKPDKIWIHHTNISYALAQSTPDISSLRESFFLSQLSDLHQISLPPKGDFLIDETYTFEIGGRHKQMKQIQDIEQAYLAKDDMEIGALNSIPLWVFGMLY